MQDSTWLVAGALSLCACGASPTLPPLRLRAPLERTIVSCNAETLHGFSPTTGSIRSMRAGSDRVSTPELLSRESFPCGDLGPGHCLDSAAEYAQRRAFSLQSASRLSRPRQERGREVVFRIGSRRVKKTFSAGAELVSFVRQVELDGEPIEILSETPLIALSYDRVEIEYQSRDQRPRDVPAADVVYEIPEGRRAKWEALRSFEDDLTGAGLMLDAVSKQRLKRELLAHVRPDAVSDSPVGLEIRAAGAEHEIPDVSDRTQPALRVELHVRCR
jgi:hypothetical protein